MAVSVSQFVKNLLASGLMSREEIQQFHQSLPPHQRPQDGKALAVELIRHKRLTRFQAEAIYRGHIKNLVLGNYALLEKIGRGGMGQVYKAQHRRMQRIVALKVLPTALSKNSTAVRRFEREVQMAARLSHPNIVTAFDADEAGATRFLVMEYVDGPNLSSLVKERGPLEAPEAVDCVRQTAVGLAYAHQHGVVHRDVKPSNLLMNSQGVVKILDLGLARTTAAVEAAATATELTGTGVAMGTIDYMAPEQAEDSKEADHRADIYSLGCTLYYLLTGQPVYRGGSAFSRALAHREKPIPSLRDLQPETPAAVDMLFQRMVAKSPHDRPQTMGEVVAELEATVSSEAPSPAARAAPPIGWTDEDQELEHFLQSISVPTAVGQLKARAKTKVTEQTESSQVEEPTAPLSPQPGAKTAGDSAARALLAKKKSAARKAGQPQPIMLIAVALAAVAALLYFLGVWW